MRFLSSGEMLVMSFFTSVHFIVIILSSVPLLPNRLHNAVLIHHRQIGNFVRGESE